LASGAFPSVADGVRDLVKKQVPLFYIFDKFKMTKVENWGPHYMVRVNDKDDSQPKAFQGLDTLSKGAVQAPRSAMFGFANYDINITIPWEDEINLTGANALGNYVEEITFKQARALGGLVSDDFIHGNQADSKKALGLEQAVPVKAHETTGDPWTASRWQFRQATNTYGGVARTAWTSATAGGSGWEPLCMDLTDLSPSPESTFLSATVGASTEAIKTFNRFLNALTYEATTPNLILSSWQPQEDMNNAGFGVQRVGQDEKGEGLDLGLSITHYKGIPWYASDRIAHSGVTVTGQTAVTKTEILYALTTSTWSHLVHSEGNWAQIPFLGLTDQAGVIGRLRLRTQLVMEDPLVNGVLANYGA
jgi:hypothetical protein